jgi:hypothetical protein
MLTSTHTICAAIALGAGALACGDDAAGDDGAQVDAGRVSDAADEGPALDAVGPLLAESLCPHFFDCCSEDDLRGLFDEIDPDPTDVPDCVAALTGPLSELVGDLEVSVDAGRLRYSGGAMASCLEQISGASCEQFGPLLGDLERFSACEPPFIPLVEDGGACARNEECIGGLCRREGDIGTCAALPGEGAPCPESTCAAGLFCDDIGSTCVPQRIDGDQCIQDDQCAGGVCVDDVCGQNPVCDGEG